MTTMEWFPDRRGAPVTATSDCWRAPNGAHAWSYNGTTLKNGMMEVKCDHCGLTRWQPMKEDA